MEVCGEAENRLASELMQHELQIEKDVLDPLSQIAEVRILTSHQLYCIYVQYLKTPHSFLLARGLFFFRVGLHFLLATI